MIDRISYFIMLSLVIHLTACTSSWNTSPKHRATKGPEPPVASGSVPVTRQPIVVDGKIDETAWKQATSYKLIDYWQQGSQLQATTVYMLHDATYLFVAFVCEDQEIISSRTEHDDQTFRDDCVELFVGKADKKIDQSLGMEINASGVVRDFHYRHRNWINLTWNPELTQVAATQKINEGYVVEIAIPFSEIAMRLNLSEPIRQLRANLVRVDRPSGITTMWSNPDYVRPYPHFPNRYGWITLILD